MNCKLYIITFICFVASGCVKENACEADIYEGSVHSVLAPDTILAGSTAEITVWHHAHDGCQKFSSFQEEKNGNDWKINVFVEDVSQCQHGCTMEAVPKSCTYMFIPESAGNYILSFGTNQYKDTIFVQ